MQRFGQLIFATAIASLGLAAACKSETAVPASAPTSATGEPASYAPPTPEVTGVPEGEPVDSGTIGGDGSKLRLDPLTTADFAAVAPKGELSCSFTATGGPGALLVASGFAGMPGSRADGVIRFAGSATRIASLEDGGFDAIVDGGRFAAQGLVLEVRRGKAPIPGAGGESPPYPAAIKAMRADGAERSFSGTWTCGP